MAALVGVFHMGHSPFCYLPPERWDAMRATRSYRDDVPFDDAESAAAKAARVKAGFEVLREQIAIARPDVYVVFGDDNLEQFDFGVHPALSLYAGASYTGHLPGSPGRRGGVDAPPQEKVPVHTGLAVHLLTGLMESHFDPAFMLKLNKPEVGICHAVMNPLATVTDLTVPTVPVMLNTYHQPQLSAARCVEIGRAVRELIDSYPEDLRVAVIGSGGLWHTHGAGTSHSYLDEEFDQEGLRYLAKGDISAWAEHFDSYRVPEGDGSQVYLAPEGWSGLPSPGGPQGGTRETCNWIGAAATADGCPTVVVDYVPVYASPIGLGFAYCTDL